MFTSFSKISLIKMFRLINSINLLDSKTAVELFLSACLITQEEDCTYLFSKKNIEHFVKFLGLFSNKRIEFINGEIHPSVSKAIDAQDLRVLLNT
jgi:hypothetical protein